MNPIYNGSNLEFDYNFITEIRTYYLGLQI